MKRPDAERLLGGYAAGILTEPEKRTLFTAALERQELFDALLDEEALRELLADPGTRQRLLAALAEPESRPGPRSWRRPAFLGLAASLFLLVTTGLVLLRRPSAPVLFSSVQESGKEAVPPQAAPGPSLPLPAPSKPAQARRAKVAAAAPEAETRPAVPPALAEESEQDATSAQGFAADQNTASLALKSRLADASKAEGAARQTGAAEANRSPAGALVKKARPLSAVLERMDGGRYRLTVHWDPAGHLYVLKRTPSGTIPLSTSTPGTGRDAAFELSLDDHDALDVYLLRLPQEDPTSLPASQEVPGEWLRVFPR